MTTLEDVTSNRRNKTMTKQLSLAVVTTAIVWSLSLTSAQAFVATRTGPIKSCVGYETTLCAPYGALNAPSAETFYLTGSATAPTLDNVTLWYPISLLTDTLEQFVASTGKIPEGQLSSATAVGLPCNGGYSLDTTGQLLVQCLLGAYATAATTRKGLHNLRSAGKYTLSNGPTLRGCFALIPNVKAKPSWRSPNIILAAETKPKLVVNGDWGTTTIIPGTSIVYARSGTSIINSTEQYVQLFKNGAKSMTGRWVARNGFIWDGQKDSRGVSMETDWNDQEYFLFACATYSVNNIPLNTRGGTLTFTINMAQTTPVQIGRITYGPLPESESAPTVNIARSANATVSTTETQTIKVPYTTTGAGLLGTVTATSNSVSDSKGDDTGATNTMYVSIADAVYGTGASRVGLSSGAINIRVNKLRPGTHIINVTLTTQTM